MRYTEIEEPFPHKYVKYLKIRKESVFIYMKIFMIAEQHYCLPLSHSPIHFVFGSSYKNKVFDVKNLYMT